VTNTDHEAARYVVFSTPVTSSLLGPNIMRLFLKTLSPYSSLKVSDQISHP